MNVPHRWDGWATHLGAKTTDYVRFAFWGPELVCSRTVYTRGVDATAAAVGVPAWLPAGLFTVLPLRWELRYRQGLGHLRRAGQGRCAACGYDLRFTPGRCPGCGTAPA